MTGSPLLKLYSTYVQRRRSTNMFRELQKQTSKHDKPFLNFSSNDYLGLSRNSYLMETCREAISKYGVGATGSRLLSGNSDVFMCLEKQIATDKGTEEALILNSGYQANLAVLGALLSPSVLKQQALVFFDKANHNSLYQGVFLSGAHLVRYPHADNHRLYDLLDSFRHDSRPKFIISDTLFGMDGDSADLNHLVSLSQEFNAFLYLDEAHATGLYGPRGYGLSTTVNLSSIPHLIMGTFSKGLGCFGAYIACSSLLKNFLINACSGFIYSTALPPALMATVEAAWQMIPTLSETRSWLQEKADYCRSQLCSLGYDIGHSHSHIIPLIFEDEKRTMKAQQKLLSKGILVSAVRPPTVPPKTSRLRLALTTNHTKNDINVFIKEVQHL